MAEVKVKLFGVLRMSSHLGEADVNIETVNEIFDVLNKRATDHYEEAKKEQPDLTYPEKLSFDDAVVFLNGEKCTKKKKKLSDGDMVWLLSPASGG